MVGKNTQSLSDEALSLVNSITFLFLPAFYFLLLNRHSVKTKKHLPLFIPWIEKLGDEASEKNAQAIFLFSSKISAFLKKVLQTRQLANEIQLLKNDISNLMVLKFFLFCGICLG